MHGLGIPVGGNPSKTDFSQPFVAKLRYRLYGWRIIFFFGRVERLQSLLSSISIYFISLSKLYKGVYRKIDSLMRKLLWEAGGEGFQDHSVSWDEVIKDKTKGGLGIRNIGKLKIILLAKWLFRFPLEKDSTWGKVITSKYGLNSNGWDSNIVTRASFWSSWKFISPGYPC